MEYSDRITRCSNIVLLLLQSGIMIVYELIYGTSSGFSFGPPSLSLSPGPSLIS